MKKNSGLPFYALGKIYYNFPGNRKDTTPIQDVWKMASGGGKLLRKGGKQYIKSIMCRLPTNGVVLF